MDQQLKEIQDYEQQRAEVQEQAKSLEAASADLTVLIKDLSERKHKAELNASKADLEIDNMQNRIWEDYELTYDGATAYRNEHSLTYSAQKTDELKKEIRELGDVYVNSIEDFKNVKERYESLYVQQQDLLKAQGDLHNLIEELLMTMRVQFKAAFALINENFGETFRRLFGGGTAELRLIDEQDVLSSEIQVIAQPPGKKLQLLSLLSGGEKALTAIALLFSMLKLKPTPFCVLDEIEASLDEANVDNFADYIKQYADNTQFILITHRKGSMSACDTLYGVAMEEKGISRLVSVKMSPKFEAV
jgi:chromosome segregation protein